MIVRRLQDVSGTARETRADNWQSRRLLLREDGMGFSMHDTVLHAGTVTPMWYKNHVEAVYCIEGKAELKDLASGEVHVLEPGTLYALDQHDRHVLSIVEDFRCVCVFNPALRGDETHDADGAYPLHPGEDAPAPQTAAAGGA